jgi:uncharacterized protein (TIGR03435 family)
MPRPAQIALFMAALPAFLAICADTPVFEVASVKLTQHGRTPDGWSRSSLDVTSPGRVVGVNASMEECIQWAYDVKEYQISGPLWLNADEASYDIEAKAPAGTSHEDLRRMFQNLLSERFHLALHREQRMMPVYNLVAKDGMKLKPAATADGHGGTSSRGGHVTGTSVSMADIAYRFSRELNRPVFDQTGVSGKFDFTLDYAREGHDDPGPSLFTAVQEQLGLKLESVKAPLDVLVIDHADRVPTGN